MNHEHAATSETSAMPLSPTAPVADPSPARPPREATRVSVVLPVYNEVQVLHSLISQVRQALEHCQVQAEIIFVDDGSSDGSARVLDQLAEIYPEVRVIHFSRNFGHQAAVQAGLAHAAGDAVVVMDADLQDDPAAIQQMLDAWRAGADVVYAVRAKRKEAAWKRALFATFHRLLASVSTTKIPADAGNFSLIDARAVRQIVALAERDRYLPGLRAWVGFRQQGIVVERNARYDAKPRVSLRGLWRLAKTAIFSFSSLPLAVFYCLGYAALGLFFALGAYSLGCRLLTDLAVPGWTSQVLIASFFGAMNALGISMLGEYVIRIYDQVRGRPLYLVDRTVNVDRRTKDRRRANNTNADKTIEAYAAAGNEIDPADEALLFQAAELLEFARKATAQAESPFPVNPTTRHPAAAT